MEIRKQFKAENAHRLVSSYSKGCQNIHGHSYVYEVVLASTVLNSDGMVMDFGEVKNIVSNFMNNFDHTCILADFDPILPKMREVFESLGMKYMVVPYNPSAENQAIHIYQQMYEFGLPVKYVKVHETLTGWASFDGSDDIQDMYVDIDKVEFHAQYDV